MKSLEIISVRMSLPEPRLKEELQAICREVRQSSAADLDVYTNGDFPGDLAIILLWPSASSLEEGTDLGNNLSAALKRFGLVDHSVWVKAGQGQESRLTKITPKSALGRPGRNSRPRDTEDIHEIRS